MLDPDTAARGDRRSLFSSVFLAALIALCFHPAGVRAESTAGPFLTVRSVTGPAWIEGAARSTPLRPGQRLGIGEAVELGGGARVRLAAATGERLELGPRSQFALENPDDAAPADGMRIRLDRGAMRLDSRKTSATSRVAIAAGAHRLQAAPGDYLVDSADASVIGCTLLGALAYDGDDSNTDMVLGGGTTRCRQLERSGAQGGASFAANPEQIALLARTLNSGAVVAPPSSVIAATAPLAAPKAMSPADHSTAAPASANGKGSSGGLVAVSLKPAIPVEPPGAASPPPATSPEIAAVLDAKEPLTTSPGAQIAPPSDIAPPEAEPAQPKWIVNVASYPDHALAERAVAKLKDAGFVATIREEIVRARTSYRVIVPGLASEEQATGATRRLVKELGFPTAWTLRTG